MKKIFLSSLLLICLCSCESAAAIDPVEIPDMDDITLLNQCNFESKTIDFKVNGTCSYSVVLNPKMEGKNKTASCGLVTTGSGTDDFIYGPLMSRKIDFTCNAPIFTMKVLSPRAGGKIKLRLVAQASTGVKPVELTAKTVGNGEWEIVYFDFTSLKPESNRYQTAYIYFGAGESHKGEKWYFDDICCPSDDLTDICLFQRNPSNPVFAPDWSRTWRGDHMANAAILSPKNSPDGNWWLYLRGSGSCPTYCDQIGLYQQSADDFHPFGPWNEYERNPVLPVGPAGSYDSGFLLDTAPVVGKDGVVYVYYNGKPQDQSTNGLCVRYSTDGGYTFNRIDAPLLVGYGCSDAVYYDGKYYIYYGGGNPCRLYVAVTEDPLSLANAQTYQTIPIGGGPSNFDATAVNGSMVFRLEGVDKWFASYQGSSNSYDFPDRFHIAMSDDLIHWTKVDNDQPLFTRGSAGAWDQGAIWFCEIFEYEDMLYLYYEGWGKYGYVEDRNAPYFSGNSRVGAASCSKADFLRWCGL